MWHLMPHISLGFFTHPPTHPPFPFPSSKFQPPFPFPSSSFHELPSFPSFPPYFHFLPHYFHPQNFKSLLLSQNLSLIHYSLTFSFPLSFSFSHSHFHTIITIHHLYRQNHLTNTSAALRHHLPLAPPPTMSNSLSISLLSLFLSLI